MSDDRNTARVYVDMVGDLFHAGHVALLREARRHGNHLVVGVLSDETAASYKRRPIMTLVERVAVIEACRWVDEVIPDAPFEVSEEFLDQHRITTVVHGDDLSAEGAEMIYGPAMARGRYVAVPRTAGISTTEVIRRVTSQPVLHLTVGLPGVGKTTLARRIAAAERIVRLTPDDWMAPLFGDNDAGGRRAVLEGRMIWVAHEVLRSGAGVVLDFGCWSPEERYAIRAVAESAGGRFALHPVTLDERERRARAGARWESAPETTFPMTDEDHDRWLASYHPPTDQELAGAPAPAPPAGADNWLHWASERWPTLPRLDEHGDV
jgi:cytidyltransferase-like protein